MTAMITTTPELTARLSATADAVEVELVDLRRDSLAMFGALAPELQRELACDGWPIGLLALGIARSVAR